VPTARPVREKEKPMTSEPIRDPRADHLLTPQNCALVIIDYQPVQVRSIRQRISRGPLRRLRFP
jgi:hypothetical protein